MKDLSVMTPVAAQEGDAMVGMRGKKAVLLVLPGAKKVLLGTVNVTQTAVTALGAGARYVQVAVPGLLATDDLMLFPTAVPPLGYSLGNVVVTGAGQAQVAVTAPLLALGASYSIPCRAVVFR